MIKLHGGPLILTILHRYVVVITAQSVLVLSYFKHRDKKYNSTTHMKV